MPAEPPDGRKVKSGPAGIYTEQVSSVREQPELDLLRRRILRPGDVLVVTRLDAHRPGPSD
jgi:hypothetical protein